MATIGAGARRALLLLLAGLALPGCFRSEALAPDRAVLLWRQAVPLQATNVDRDPTGKARRLSLDQALALALQDNPSLRVLEARLAQARAEEGEAVQLENPEIRIRDIEVDKIAEDQPVVDLALRVPIPMPWILDARSRKAELETEEVRARLDGARRGLRLRIRRLFATLALLQQEQQELGRSLELLDRHVRHVAQGLAAGVATRLDHASARLKVAEVADRLGAVRSDHGETVLLLRRLVGIHPSQPVTFLPARLVAAPVDRALDDQALIQQALRRQPDLREAAARVGVAEADAYIARAERWPWLRFAEVNYGFTPNLDPLNFEFSLAVTVPLLSWNQGRIKAREARVARRRLEEKARLMEVAQDVSQACENVRLTAARLRTMARSLMPAVKDIGAALDEAASRGAIDPLDAIVGETRRVRARSRYLKALMEHQIALIELDASAEQK